ncbi:MAG TPA: energy-coupling factor ABC transporter permease [Ilumatobacter sp.]|nr:energy-coupling factor ABC transporter permease [Ilumatobacter sp.]
MIGLHAPDGFLEPDVAIATAIIAFAAVAFTLRVTNRELSDKQVPLAGIAAAFIFAAQMFNFPVASGTTGHLLGGSLAAILLGPSAGALVVTVVVIVQALVFADGGLTALGYNTLNMAIIPAFGGWALFQLFRKVLPKNTSGVIGATALASGLTVVLAAVAFSLQWLFGASAPVPFDTVFGAMVGVHLLIGIGEAVISGLAVGAVLAARPDLVAGAADLSIAQLADRRRIGARAFALGGLLTAIFFAVVVSQFAGSSPDGLERVAVDEGFIDSGRDHAFDGSLFSDYATSGIGNENVSLAVAGVCGVVLTLVVGLGLISAARRPRTRLTQA